MNIVLVLMNYLFHPAFDFRGGTLSYVLLHCVLRMDVVNALASRILLILLLYHRQLELLSSKNGDVVIDGAVCRRRFVVDEQ